jgi:hypothetical protein
MAKRNRYLVKSPYAVDGEALIGCDPRALPQDLHAEIAAERGKARNPIKAIRAKCIEWSGGSMAEARKCVFYDCALWPLRMGVNIFRKKLRRRS